MRNRLKYYSGTITKYILAISLFANIFVFSSSAENVRLQHEQTAQNELVVVEKNKRQKRIFCYQKALQQLIKNKYLNVFWFSNNSAVRIFNNITKAKFDSFRALFRNLSFVYQNRLQKLLPQNPSEDLISC